MEKATKMYPVFNRSSEKSNLHKSFSKILLVAQIFGFLPVQGILGPDFRSLHFSWKSIRVVYSIFTIFGTCVISGFQLQKILNKGLDLLEANRVFFLLSGVVSAYLHFDLAKKWPKFLKDWCKIDSTFSSYGWPNGLDKKLNTLFTVFLLMALSKINLKEKKVKLHFQLSIFCFKQTNLCYLLIVITALGKALYISWAI